MTDGSALVAALAAGPLELAQLASIAGRVERQLLRALRLELAPWRTAADEADLWFSPIVQNSAATGLVFVPEALSILQRQLANDPLRRLDSAWHVIFRLRAGAPYAERARVTHSTWLLVQEELTWWALRGGGANATDQERVRTLFAWIENSRAEEGVARDADAWIRSARLRLPAEAWTLPGAARLTTSANSIARPQSFWVRRVKEGIEVSEQQLSGGHLVRGSTAGGPLRIEVLAHGDAPTEARALFIDRSIAFVAAKARTVDLMLSDGQAFALDLVDDAPGTDETAERERFVVNIRSALTYWKGVLVGPQYVLTCAHVGSGAEVVEVPSGYGEHPSPPRLLRATTVARSPFEWLPPLPVPFGAPADDLALLRLESAVDDIAFFQMPVVDMNQPVVGQMASIYASYSSTDMQPASQSDRVDGIVCGVGDQGYEIELADSHRPLPGSSGSPVWLGTHGLLGVLVAFRETPKPVALVAPARPLDQLLRGVQRRILVAGSGEPTLPEPVWRLATSLGRALARTGYVLVCGGWPGVDNLVARTFETAVADDRSLRSRLVQLVEEDRSPDFKAAVAPIMIDPVDWAKPMVEHADAVVALGGLGGTLSLCRQALETGRPVLPIPATGGDADQLYQDMQQGRITQPFPDRRALYAVTHAVGTQQEADSMAARIVELLGICLDESKLRRYREFAAAMLVIVNDAAFPLVPQSPLEPFRIELRAAAGGMVLPDDTARAMSLLRANLPVGMLWLIDSLFALDGIEELRAVDKLRAAALSILLADTDGFERLARALVDRSTTAKDLQSQQSVWLRAIGQYDATLADALNRLFQRALALQTTRRALTELHTLAGEFLRPVDMATFNATYRKLDTATRESLALIDDGIAAELLTSVDPAPRTVGYVRFLAEPSQSLVTVLGEALRLERITAFSQRETRPLWLLLEALSTVLESDDLAVRLPPGIEPALADLLTGIQSRKDVDPGRECSGLLQTILRQFARIRTTTRFASYSRYMGKRQGQDRYAWCVFVAEPRTRLDSIAEVEYRLHPTFPDPVRRVSDPAHCFALQSEGWGGFTVHIRVIYKSGAVTSQDFALRLELNSWPLGPVFDGARDAQSTIVYAALRDRRWDWRNEGTLARQAGITGEQVRAILNDLARGDFVREAFYRSAGDETLWGATAKVGLLPKPVE